MTYYWIKLYHEILHDPKMGRLPDHAWRRCIELFLIAGENNQLGELPPVEDMAWTLRIDVAELRRNLLELVGTGILHSEDDVTYFVTHFAERQDADTPKERAARYRERERKINADVTQPSRNVTQTVTNVVPDIDIDKDKDKESDIESEEEQKTSGDCFALYSSEKFGEMTQIISEKLGDYIDTYTASWVYDAMVICVNANKRNLAYLGGILKKWKSNGKSATKKSADISDFFVNVEAEVAV